MPNRFRRRHPADSAPDVTAGGAAARAEIDGATHPHWLRRPILGRSADRDLAAHLVRELTDLGDVLHDVRFPDAAHSLDHLVVAPSGIWLIDMVHIAGRVERRDVGTRGHPEYRLLLEGTDRSDLVDHLGTLRKSRHAVARFAADIDVHRVVCLIDATWSISARPFQVGDVWVTWPRALTDKIRSSGLVPIRTAHEIAAAITAASVEGPGDSVAHIDIDDRLHQAGAALHR